MNAKRINTGLVSVTFRSRGIAEIAALTKKAGLDEIEWGGDVHVPHGDIAAAKSAREASAREGLEIYSYGTYYRLPADGAGFDTVLDTAEALGAKSLRIWAGTKGARDTDVLLRAAMNETLAKNADAASARGMEISFEYHGGTLTDGADSALRLLRDCEPERKNVRLHWQPNQYKDTEYNIAALHKVAAFVDIVHVFAWDGDNRLPLAEHEDAWRRYFDILRTEGNPRAALLEFLPTEGEDDLLRDAETLFRVLEK